MVTAVLDLNNLPDTKVSVSDFIDLINETFEFGFPSIVVSGELANLRVSRGRWVYFDLKDDTSSLKCFGTVRHLPGPLEDGMVLEVRGAPGLHNLYGFSFNVQIIRPAGEGSLKRAAELLAAKLKSEGLFDDSRKRQLPHPPERIGLITSAQSAAYADFTKILAARWGGVSIDLIDVQVQGDAAAGQLVAAIEAFNAQASPPEVLVIIRGGGSADDLAAFSTEQVTRAVAASRVPTLVAIGHEIDVSLSELAADMRASTPSNAAELLTPDKRVVIGQLSAQAQRLGMLAQARLQDERVLNESAAGQLQDLINGRLQAAQDGLAERRQLLEAFNPQAVLRRGYAIVRGPQGGVYAKDDYPREGDIVKVELQSASFDANVTKLTRQ